MKRADQFADVGDLVYCFCDTPIARRSGRQELELIKFYRGRPVKTRIEYGDQAKVVCEECGFGAIFLNIKESTGVNDALSVSLA